MKEAEGSKTKKKNTYTLMLFVDSKEGRIRQMSIGPGFIESVMVIGLAVMIILGVFCYRYKTSIEILEAENAAQKEDIVKMRIWYP